MINKEYHKTDKDMNLELQEIELAKQDPKHFEVLYNRYFEQIFRYIYQRLDDPQIASDIVSQVFLKALTKLETYEFKGVPFVSWLYRIAFNELNMHFRKISKNRSINIDDSGLSLITDAFEIEEDEDRLQDVLNALKDLPEDALQLIEMRFFEERSFKEIGEILEITENNAKVKLYRTIDKLKKLIIERT